MKKLRLLITEKCNRACPGCCNKDWNLEALPVCNDFEGWDEVMITGGEPMLVPGKVMDAICAFPIDTPVFLYTAKVDQIWDLLPLLDVLNGITLTLHDQGDVIPFVRLNGWLLDKGTRSLSLRLNVFKGVQLPSNVDLSQWKVKADMVWRKDCPLPEGEVFMRWE